MSNLNFNIFNILIFSGIMQGVIFSFVVFLHNKYKSQTNNFIALTVLVLSLSNLQYWFIDIGLKGFFIIFYDFRVPCDLLIVPAFYLYVNSYLQNKNKNKVICLLGLPFMLSLGYNLLLFRDEILSNEFTITINIALETFSLLFNFLLIILIVLKIRDYERNNEAYDKSKVKVRTKWLKQILSIGGALCLFWFAEILFVQRENSIGLSVYYPLWIGISILVYWISYVGLFNSNIYKERIQIRRMNVIIPMKTEKEDHSNKLNEKLFEDISRWIIEDKVYLNPNLNLSLVSNKFKISNGYLSQLLSSNSEFQFNDFINSLRTKEAQRILANNTYNQYTIIAIGLESGFNSKSSFYSAFKKFTGITPVQYKKIVRNN